ncbi:MAG: EAL domain-containing protein [Mycobacteriales bacterium]
MTPAVPAACAARALTSAVELDAALDAGLLTVVYQPVVDLRTGAVVAAESLVRLRVPGSDQLITPDGFVPLAEATGRIGRIDEQVRELAVPQAAQWRALLPGRPFSVGVNVSAAGLHPRLADHVAELSQRHGVPTNAIVVELTETALSVPGQGHGAVLRALSALDCNVTLDDFGTGYSALADLRRFPVNGIKIDRTFVADLDSGPVAARLAGALVRFGLDLGVHVVAEGIETPSQLAALQALGCPFGQGYLIARPLPPAAFTTFLLSRGSVVPLQRSAP